LERLRADTVKLGAEDVFRCPCSGDDFSYEGFPKQMTSNSGSQLVLAWDKQPHPDGRRNVVTVDGHVSQVDEASFRKWLEESGVSPPPRPR
ncbi:hypothetical protein HY251_11395, partial [bacterium]|nr:hypothetical protein [bacterium]